LTSPNLMESGSRAPAHRNGKANIARALIDAFSTQCKAWCILAGYDQLPNDFDTGIDFMVSQQDFDRMPAILDQVARKTGTRLFQAIDHEPTGRAFFLGSMDGPVLTIVQPDCAADYRHFGRLWLPAAEVLRARRLHPRGFYIPSTAHEFAYTLIKRLHERSFHREHGYRLHRLYVEDRIECGRMIARFWRGPEGSAIVRMASANDWTAMYKSIEPFRAAMLRSRKSPLAEAVKDLPRNLLYLLRRIAHPTGCWIAVMGPDGCGRSFVLTAITGEFARSFRSVRAFQLRPWLIGRNPLNHGTVTDPHGKPPHGKVASIARVLDLWLDYLLGYAFRILPGIIRTDLVLFDRCFYDLMVDSNRIRYGGPPGFLRAAARSAPGPDLVILLDAPPEMLQSGNPQVSTAPAALRRAAYLDLARTLPSAVVVNAAQPADDVIRDTLTAIIDHLARRTGNRLGLSGRAFPSPKP